MTKARKLSFQEAWDTSVVFFVSDALEHEIEAAVETLLETAQDRRVSEAATITVDNIESRAFVNFVDGGGWLARKRDLQRLVEHCHYFINLNHLDMLESSVLKHVPRKYVRRSPRRR